MFGHDSARAGPAQNALILLSHEWAQENVLIQRVLLRSFEKASWYLAIEDTRIGTSFHTDEGSGLCLAGPPWIVERSSFNEPI
jgi:hypothetical protein